MIHQGAPLHGAEWRSRWLSAFHRRRNCGGNGGAHPRSAETAGAKISFYPRSNLPSLLLLLLLLLLLEKTNLSCPKQASRTGYKVKVYLLIDSQSSISLYSFEILNLNLIMYRIM